MLQNKLTRLNYVKNHTTFIYQTTQMNFRHCEAVGSVHVYDERPSWWLLPLYSVTDSVQERRLRLPFTPPLTDSQSHDVTLPPFMSAISSKAFHPVFLNFLYKISMFGCITSKQNYCTLKGSRKMSFRFSWFVAHGTFSHTNNHFCDYNIIS